MAEPPANDTKGPRMSVKAALIAALPGLLIGIGNSLDQSRNREVIAQESVRVDESVWPKLADTRERLLRLEEWRRELDQERAAEEAAELGHVGTSTVHLPSPPSAPAKDSAAVKEKMEKLF